MKKPQVGSRKRSPHIQCQRCSIQWLLWGIIFLLASTCSAAVQGHADGNEWAKFQIDSTATPGAARPLDTLWSDTKAVFTEGLQIFSAPLRFGGLQWGITGGVAAGTGLMMMADDEARKQLTQSQDTLSNRLSEVGNYYGTLIPGLALSSGLYVGGLMFDEPSVRRTGRHVFQAMLYAGTITTVAKMLIGPPPPILERRTIRLRRAFIEG